VQRLALLCSSCGHAIAPVVPTMTKCTSDKLSRFGNTSSLS